MQGAAGSVSDSDGEGNGDADADADGYNELDDAASDNARASAKQSKKDKQLGKNKDKKVGLTLP